MDKKALSSDRGRSKEWGEGGGGRWSTQETRNEEEVFVHPTVTIIDIFIVICVTSMSIIVLCTYIVNYQTHNSCFGNVT